MSYHFIGERTENEKSPSKSNRLLCANSRYGFILHQDSNVDPSAWVLFKLWQNEDVSKFKELHFPDGGPSLPGLLVNLWHKSLKEIIETPGFYISNCQTVKSDNQELVELVFEINNKENQEELAHQAGKQSCQKGKVLLDPKRFWCVRESEAYWNFGSAQCVSRMKVVEMGLARDSLPWPKHVVIDAEFGDTKKKRNILAISIYRPPFPVPRNFECRITACPNRWA